MNIRNITLEEYSREELELLSKEELVELFLQLQDLALDYM